MALDYQRTLYHVGYGCRISAPRWRRSVPLLVSHGRKSSSGISRSGRRARGLQIPLRFTYSCEGPQHVELLQGAPGSLWDGDDRPGVHHMGVWVNDVAAETERLIEAGWTLEMAGRAPDEGYGPMTYVRSPGGFLLEPVSVAVRPRFERWWAGGPFT